MINKLMYVIVAFFFSINSLFSQTSLVANTGDKEFDNFLKDLNIQAQADLKIFNKNLSVKYNVPENKIETLIVKDKIAPADVFMILETAQLVNLPVDNVTTAYHKNKDKGWGVIAKELGIKPGSEKFHALKKKTKEEKTKGNTKGKKEKGKPIKKSK